MRAIPSLLCVRQLAFKLQATLSAAAWPDGREQNARDVGFCQPQQLVTTSLRANETCRYDRAAESQHTHDSRDILTQPGTEGSSPDAAGQCGIALQQHDALDGPELVTLCPGAGSRPAWMQAARFPQRRAMHVPLCRAFHILEQRCD